jgi:hypothetical protein
MRDTFDPREGGVNAERAMTEFTDGEISAIVADFDAFQVQMASQVCELAPIPGQRAVTVRLVNVNHRPRCRGPERDRLLLCAQSLHGRTQPDTRAGPGTGYHCSFTRHATGLT